MTTTPDTGGWDDGDEDAPELTPRELEERLRNLESRTPPEAIAPSSNKSAFGMAVVGAAILAGLLYFGNFFRGCFRIEPRLPEATIVSKSGGALVTPDRNEQGHATGVMRIGTGVEEVIIQSSRNFLVKNRKDGKIEHPPIINRDTGQRDEYSPRTLFLEGDSTKITIDPRRIDDIKREHSKAKNEAPYAPPPLIVTVVCAGKKAEIDLLKDSSRFDIINHYTGNGALRFRSKNDAEVTLNLPPDVKLKDVRLVVLGEGTQRLYALCIGDNLLPSAQISSFNQTIIVKDGAGQKVTLCGKNSKGEELPLLPSDGFVPLRDTSRNYAIPINVGITLEELLKQEPDRRASLEGLQPLHLVAVEESSRLVPFRVNYQEKI